jgi:hypothetical protein
VENHGTHGIHGKELSLFREFRVFRGFLIQQEDSHQNGFDLAGTKQKEFETRSAKSEIRGRWKAARGARTPNASRGPVLASFTAGQ